MKSRKDLNLTKGQLRSLIIAILHTPENTDTTVRKKSERRNNISREENKVESTHLSLNRLLYECNQMLMQQFTAGPTDSLQSTSH